MIVESAQGARGLRNSVTFNADLIPHRILMVSPDFYRVSYAINPHMRDSSGKLKTVDKANALEQWTTLKSIFEKLGLPVSTIKGAPGLPDMVFAANQAFVFHFDGTTHALLAQMAHEARRDEVIHFRKFFETSGYTVDQLDNSQAKFEGHGDALLVPGTKVVFGGHGFRTDYDVYAELSDRFGFDIVPIQLQNESFYHLDTCLSIINPDCAVVVENAFEPEGLKMIRSFFKTIIEVSDEESRSALAANCFSPNGQTVLVEKSAPALIGALETREFEVIPVDTSEFLKAGGSIFCLKMAIF
ncbi:MAG: amidinotransferase [Oligoflexia bacterium]|nr:amidinotransferase [Oligoflexia bacterium]